MRRSAHFDSVGVLSHRFGGELERLCWAGVVARVAAVLFKPKQQKWTLKGREGEGSAASVISGADLSLATSLSI